MPEKISASAMMPEVPLDGAFTLVQMPDFISGRPATKMAEANVLVAGHEAMLTTGGDLFRAARILCLQGLYDPHFARDLMVYAITHAVETGGRLS